MYHSICLSISMYLCLHFYVLGHIIVDTVQMLLIANFNYILYFQRMSTPTFTQLERVKSSNAVKRKRDSFARGSKILICFIHGLNYLHVCCVLLGCGKSTVKVASEEDEMKR